MPYIAEDVKENRLSALAQLCELLIADGLTTTQELCKRTGYGERAIRKARAELECRNSSAGNRVPNGTLVRNSSSPAKERVSPHTPLPKENNLSPRTNVEPASNRAHEPEDDLLAGLNGSTAIILRDVVTWANMPERNAKNWLATTVSAYGPEVTKAAHQKLKTELASGSLIAQPLATMSRIAQRLKTEGVGKPKAAFKPSRW